MRFLCDAMLGRLAKYLRILGLDTIYVRSISDLAAYKADDETSYFFTKRKLQRISYYNTVYIKADNVVDQLREIRNIILPCMLKREPMNRCVKCNAVLGEVRKDDVESFVPEFVFHKYDMFKVCPSCNKVYWEGSHVEHMKLWIREITKSTGDPDEG